MHERRCRRPTRRSTGRVCSNAIAIPGAIVGVSLTVLRAGDAHRSLSCSRAARQVSAGASFSCRRGIMSQASISSDGGGSPYSVRGEGHRPGAIGSEPEPSISMAEVPSGLTPRRRIRLPLRERRVSRWGGKSASAPQPHRRLAFSKEGIRSQRSESPRTIPRASTSTDAEVAQRGGAMYRRSLLRHPIPRPADPRSQSLRLRSPE